jgi:hypothetical protein
VLEPRVVSVYVKKLYQALNSIPQRATRYRRKRIIMQGLESTEMFEDMPVQNLMVPYLSYTFEQRIELLTLALPMLDAKKRAYGQVREALGRDITNFMLFKAKDPGNRFALLLWALSRFPGVEKEMNKAEGTFLLHENSATYGVHKHVITGCEYEGVPLPVKLDSVFYDKRTRQMTSHGYQDIDAMYSFAGEEPWRILLSAIYERAVWDERIPITSIMMHIGTATRNIHIAELEDLVLTSEKLHDDLSRKLKYRYLSPFDFTNIFGKPNKNSTFGYRTRCRILNALYLMPFVDTDY